MYFDLLKYSLRAYRKNSGGRGIAIQLLVIFLVLILSPENNAILALTFFVSCVKSIALFNTEDTQSASSLLLFLFIYLFIYSRKRYLLPARAISDNIKIIGIQPWLLVFYRVTFIGILTFVPALLLLVGAAGAADNYQPWIFYKTLSFIHVLLVIIILLQEGLVISQLIAVALIAGFTFASNASHLILLNCLLAYLNYDVAQLPKQSKLYYLDDLLLKSGWPSLLRIKPVNWFSLRLKIMLRHHGYFTLTTVVTNLLLLSFLLTASSENATVIGPGFAVWISICAVLMIRVLERLNSSHNQFLPYLMSIEPKDRIYLRDKLFVHLVAGIFFSIGGVITSISAPSVLLEIFLIVCVSPLVTLLQARILSFESKYRYIISLFASLALAFLVFILR